MDAFFHANAIFSWCYLHCLIADFQPVILGHKNEGRSIGSNVYMLETEKMTVDTILIFLCFACIVLVIVLLIGTMGWRKCKKEKIPSLLKRFLLIEILVFAVWVLYYVSIVVESYFFAPTHLPFFTTCVLAFVKELFQITIPCAIIFFLTRKDRKVLAAMQNAPEEKSL